MVVKQDLERERNYLSSFCDCWMHVFNTLEHASDRCWGIRVWLVICEILQIFPGMDQFHSRSAAYLVCSRVMKYGATQYFPAKQMRYHGHVREQVVRAAPSARVCGAKDVTFGNIKSKICVGSFSNNTHVSDLPAFGQGVQGIEKLSGRSWSGKCQYL